MTEEKKSRAKCPQCGGQKAYSAMLCLNCRLNGVKPWDEVAMLYSYRNPDDPITKEKAKRVGDAAMQKLRRKLAALELGDPEDGDSLGIAVAALAKEVNNDG